MRFAPELNELDIKKEAVRMATKALEAQAEKEFEERLKREREEADQALVRWDILDRAHDFIRKCNNSFIWINFKN